ncbi:hypothetical protein [Methylorubrum sp. GM97]|uniref:hypothetical protein n=1 Tax=Methylorubrum sp. GM97 TaxID=2938232 RepID=UPI0021896F9A|nr:hypothetical protein [Methylorubrum sp. GM97]BDL41080.1 hypothetical protein MSPGM_36700 [Methylorubrum sp. GM97]
MQIGYATPGGAGAVDNVGGGVANTSGFTLGAGAHSHTFGTDLQGSHFHNITVSLTPQGGGAAMNWLPPFILVSTYLKL